MSKIVQAEFTHPSREFTATCAELRVECKGSLHEALECILMDKDKRPRTTTVVRFFDEKNTMSRFTQKYTQAREQKADLSAFEEKCLPLASHELLIRIKNLKPVAVAGFDGAFRLLQNRAVDELRQIPTCAESVWISVLELDDLITAK
ncbi:MAG: hypothetical protein JWO43_575 [Candidatus Adlerbacteria bacterium]|nr:hypothetical protein [Candidatus Adlerbacteria bacterium]